MKSFCVSPPAHVAHLQHQLLVFATKTTCSSNYTFSPFLAYVAFYDKIAHHTNKQGRTYIGATGVPGPQSFLKK
ncbi:hypothetical protein HanXRQr2_Chr02g0075151 [Helianthus annuus]|uniref:Uncharacterized protein n=1 Tax=Helianthus annuus TaxID=4232 RepID=A0A9K3P0V0_HELAN|nr:hypothetical protein HanXRQr2_Chr02g0075151 [Helianthus annuus]